MNLTERLLSFTLLGAEWVLWLLLFLSILSVAIMVERALFMRAPRLDLETIRRKLPDLLAKKETSAALALFGNGRGPEGRVAKAGLEAFDRGRDAVGDAMAGVKAAERMALEQRLGILGTLGNNAPFVGLFGTVLGIIKAFSDLAQNRAGGADVVMAGISEALVATAVGLLVAIPAVVAFNIFQGRIRRTMARIDALAHLLLSVGAQPTASPAQQNGKAEQRD